ncbi:hypothetical protein G6F66_015581 [Rhizopus arrhizus]|nr:hypothetical protein G6F66_015581 [Rhizopus arrhizus]
MKAATWRVGARSKVRRQMGRPSPPVDNGRHWPRAAVAAGSSAIRGRIDTPSPAASICIKAGPPGIPDTGSLPS